jgi:hypothetical protein
MRTIRTPGKKRIILETMAQGLTMTESARAAGISRNAVFEWRRDDPAFAAEFEQAYAEGTDVWEAEGRRRAFTESDTLFIFLMKARDPERFNRRMLAIGGDPNAPPIAVDVDERVHFYMPSNGRDHPEELEADEPPTIEGTAKDEAEDKGEAA